ncbi:MAG: CBS domain-containing protein [Pseudomonadota bacterium]
MKVEQILQAKGTEVFAVRDSATISDAVSVLNEKNIGAVVVRDDKENIVGILSERDVVRRLGKEGSEALSMSVRECMTPDPFTCSPQANVDDLMAQMTEKRIRHLPVTHSGDIVGVVSIGDVVKRKIAQAEREAAELRSYIASCP